MQVKGRVAFASSLARKTPSGKAVREKKMPPRDRDYCKIGWHKKGIRRKQGVRVGGTDGSRKKHLILNTSNFFILPGTDSMKKKNATKGEYTV